MVDIQVPMMASSMSHSSLILLISFLKSFKSYFIIPNHVPFEHHLVCRYCECQKLAIGDAIAIDIDGA